MSTRKKPWNKGKIVGRKKPLTPEQVATIRTLLSQDGNVRDIAMFALAIDSSLRGIDIVSLNVSDVSTGLAIKTRVTIEQRKTHERVTFALRDYTRVALKELIEAENKAHGAPLFCSQKRGKGQRLSVDRYRRLVKEWIALARLDAAVYGSHSLRRTRVAHIYRKTANLRVAQVLLGHKSIENTARYLGIEEEQAVGIAEQFEGNYPPPCFEGRIVTQELYESR